MFQQGRRLELPEILTANNIVVLIIGLTPSVYNDPDKVIVCNMQMFRQQTHFGEDYEPTVSTIMPLGLISKNHAQDDPVFISCG